MKQSVDIGKAFSHLFADEDWPTKAIVGAVLSMVPVLNFAVIGYELQVIRNVGQGEQRPVPRWDDIGKFFMGGLQLGLAHIVLALPLIAFFFIPFILLFLFPFFIAIFIESSPDPDTAEQMAGVVFGVVMLFFFFGLAIASALSLLLGFVSPAITANYVRRGAFAACFQVSEIIAFIRRNFNNYILVWVAQWLVGVVVAAVYLFVAFIPCIGGLLALPVAAGGAFFAYMVIGHALGQAIAFDPLPAAPQGDPRELPTT